MLRSAARTTTPSRSCAIPAITRRDHRVAGAARRYHARAATQARAAGVREHRPLRRRHRVAPHGAHGARAADDESSRARKAGLGPCSPSSVSAHRRCATAKTKSTPAPDRRALDRMRLPLARQACDRRARWTGRSSTELSPSKAIAPATACSMLAAGAPFASRGGSSTTNPRRSPTTSGPCSTPPARRRLRVEPPMSRRSHSGSGPRPSMPAPAARPRPTRAPPPTRNASGTASSVLGSGRPRGSRSSGGRQRARTRSPPPPGP